MRKAVATPVTIALIVALAMVWIRSAPIATELVMAAGVKPSTGAISPSELMSKSSKRFQINITRARSETPQYPRSTAALSAISAARGLENA